MRYKMSDYVLTLVASRPAKVGDKLVTRNFGTGTRGFADITQDCPTAVCVLPGTEIAFNENVATALGAFYFAAGAAGPVIDHRVAIFRQLSKDIQRVHHDALEFPDGKQILLTDLEEGHTATILQLPAAPKTEA